MYREYTKTTKVVLCVSQSSEKKGVCLKISSVSLCCWVEHAFLYNIFRIIPIPTGFYWNLKLKSPSLLETETGVEAETTLVSPGTRYYKLVHPN